MDLKMSPQRPYLLRALYDWLVDNQCTPHLIVDATRDYVDVPQEHVQDGQIVLNVHPEAVTRFTMDNTHVSFEARFGGAARRIWVPMVAVTAIYARENGAGTIFEEEPGLEENQSRPESAPEVLQPVPDQGGADLSGSGQQQSEKPAPAKSGKGKPSLKVVK